MYSFRVSVSCISNILPKVCEALFKDKYLHPPSSAQQLEKIAHEFRSRWRFPHVVGAIDGKQLTCVLLHTLGQSILTTRSNSALTCQSLLMQMQTFLHLTFALLKASQMVEFLKTVA